MADISPIVIDLVKGVGTDIIKQSADTLLKKEFSWKGLFSKKEPKILLLGSTGVGKTQFINSFDDKLKDIPVKDRTIIAEEVSRQVDEHITVVFNDTAGDNTSPQYKTKRFEQLVKTFQDPGYIGIVNLTSYGYHENPYESKSNIFDTNGILKADFLERKRAYELSQLEEWLPHLQISKARFIITLINKADIWANRHQEVVDYYAQGDYAKKFKEYPFLQPHYVMPYCSLIELFYGISNSGMYGTVAQKTHKNTLIYHLSKLVK